MGLQKSQTATTEFVSIIGGKFRKQTTESDPEAVKREYETSDGKKGVKFELVFDSVEGVIENIEFVDTDYGKTMHIFIGGVKVSLGTDGRYFGDIIKRLSGADLTKTVKLVPYDFETDGKRLTGVSVQQGGEKLKNYFYDGKNNLHGFPEMTESNPDSDDWKAYFIQVKKFLIKYVQNNFEFKASASDFSDMEPVDDSLPF